MNDAMKERGRRAVSAGWRWVGGARDGGYFDERFCDFHGGFPVYDVIDVGPSGVASTVEFHDPHEDSLPDFGDAATVGCLDAQLASRFGCPIVVLPFGKGYRAHRLLPSDSGTCDYVLSAITHESEPIDAKIAALEAAPKVAP